VDRFKFVNDTYGHKAGDKALKVIAEILQENLRGTDFLARYGGEEFVIVMPSTALSDAFPVAEKLRAAIEASDFHYREQFVPITISCGMAGFRAGDTPETVFGRADSALYRAKKAGGNQCIADQ
jgi:diguanylate cyclase